MTNARPKWQFWFLITLVGAVVVVAGLAFVYPFAPFLHPGQVRVDFYVKEGCKLRKAELGGSRLMMDARIVWTSPGWKKLRGEMNGRPIEMDVLVPHAGGLMTIGCDPPDAVIEAH
jgi:hypothetical protein